MMTAVAVAVTVSTGTPSTTRKKNMKAPRSMTIDHRRIVDRVTATIDIHLVYMQKYIYG